MRLSLPITPGYCNTRSEWRTSPALSLRPGTWLDPAGERRAWHILAWCRSHSARPQGRLHGLAQRERHGLLAGTRASPRSAALAAEMLEGPGPGLCFPSDTAGGGRRWSHRCVHLSPSQNELTHSLRLCRHRPGAACPGTAVPSSSAARSPGSPGGPRGAPAGALGFHYRAERGYKSEECSQDSVIQVQAASVSLGLFHLPR